MSRIAIASLTALLIAGHSHAAEPITLRDMERTHVAQGDRLGGAGVADDQQRRDRSNGNA